jgi:hypothetical protein
MIGVDPRQLELERIAFAATVANTVAAIDPLLAYVQARRADIELLSIHDRGLHHRRFSAVEVQLLAARDTAAAQEARLAAGLGLDADVPGARDVMPRDYLRGLVRDACVALATATTLLCFERTGPATGRHATDGNR